MLEDTGRVNLIVGRNNAGKTSVLEAIELLLTGNPRALRRSESRFFPSPPFTSPERRMELAFNDLSAKQISVVAHVSRTIPQGERRLDVDYNETFSLSAKVHIAQAHREEQEVLTDEEQLDDEPVSLLEPTNEVIVRLFASYDSGRLEESTISQGFSNHSGASEIRRSRSPQFPKLQKLTVLGVNRRDSSANAQRFSAILRADLAHLLMQILHQMEPRIERLVVLTADPKEVGATSLNRERPVLEVKLSGLSTTLPLSSMGDGFQSVISIIGTIISAEGGVSTIDEIENGLHYSSLEALWRAVGQAVLWSGTQLWATTHSHECVLSAAEYLGHLGADVLRVHRLERDAFGNLDVVTLKAEEIGSFADKGWEYR